MLCVLRAAVRTQLQLPAAVSLGVHRRFSTKSPEPASPVDVSTATAAAAAAPSPPTSAATEAELSALTKTVHMTNQYLQLGKAKLSSLVVISTLAGYGVATAGLPFNAPVFGCLAAGTFLGAASAAGLNQCIEVNNDSRMIRTQQRPLVSGQISLKNAWLASAVAGIGGVGFLAVTVNPLTAALCATTIGLYAGIYTPMKQKHYLNTWVGAVVGAIPPVMGFTAVSNSITTGSLVMAALLFSWQLPHFLALAYMYREDYARGGYQMLASINAKHNADVILRHCLYLVPITVLAPAVGITDWYFAAEGVAISSVFAVLAYQFRAKNNAKNARRVFFFSLLYLPLMLLLMVVHREPSVTLSFMNICPHETVQAESIIAKQSDDEGEKNKKNEKNETAAPASK